MDEMTYYAVNAGMTLATVLFLIGYTFRKSDVQKHRILMSSGVGAVLLTAVLLVVSVHLIHNSSMQAAGFFPAAPRMIILIHRLVATVATVLMLLMLWSGATRRREFHIKTHRLFIPFYLVVYVSGLVIFSNTPNS